MMLNDTIKELLNETGAPCVSIIIPMHKLSNERLKDVLVVKQMVENAKIVLSQNYSITGYDIKKIINRIDDLVEAIDYTHSKYGLGIFVSQHTAQMIKFPFHVVEKIKIGDTFESRDLLYYLNSIPEYYVLALSQEHVHLFAAKGEELSEVSDKEFPSNYVDKFEYAKPARANSFGSNATKGFERDKSVMEEIRVVEFFRTVDRQLEKYIDGHQLLIISGGKKEIADYMEVTNYSKNIIGKVTGNYLHNGHSQLANLSWNEVQRHVKQTHEELIQSLHELIGKQMLAIGVEEVWNAAIEGKGLELVVEKDLSGHAYISVDGLELKLKKPLSNKEYVYISDAVERIIRQVMEKDGNVVFVDNGQLKEFSGIALKLRYSGV